MIDIILRNVDGDGDRMHHLAGLFLTEHAVRPRRLGLGGCIIYSYGVQAVGNERQEEASYIVTLTRTAVVVRRNELSPRQREKDPGPAKGAP